MNVLKFIIGFLSLSNSFQIRQQQRLVNVNIWRSKKQIRKLSRRHPDCVSHLVDIAGLATPFILIGLNCPDKQ